MIPRGLLAIVLVLFGVAQARTTRTVLVPSTRAAGDRFGAALDGAGTTLVVGAPGRDGHGAVFVFVADALQATLTPADARPGDEFGAALAVDGDTLVAGAPGRGAAWVFTRAAGVWSERAMLAPAGLGRAGAAVDVAGDLVVIGAPAAALDGRAESGAAVAFRGAGDAWTPIGAAVDASALQAGDRAGHAVATDGTWVVVGAPRRDGPGGAVDAGIVFVGTRGGDAVVPAGTVAMGAPGENDRFGSGVDVRGDALAVGVPSGSVFTGSSIITGPGWVEMFGLAGGAWTPTARLSAFGPGNTRGESVRLGATRVLSGAPYAEGPAHVFGEACALFVGFRTGATWLDAQEPLQADVDVDDEARVTSGLGRSVAFTDDALAGGAPEVDDARGIVYLFRSRAPVFDTAASATPAAARLLEPVQFAGGATDPDDDDVSLFWDFGDGHASRAAPASHRYVAPGGYDVRLLASDGIAEASSVVHVDVLPPTNAVTQLELTERVRRALVPVGGGGDGEGETNGDDGGGERDFATTSLVKLRGVLALTPADTAALDAAGRFRLGLGEMLVDVGLGDDPRWAPGKAKAKIVVSARGDDDGSGGLRYLTLRLDWSRGDLAFKLKLVPSQGFRTFASSPVGDDLVGTPSGTRVGSVTGAVGFGPATATVVRSWSAKVKTVDRESRGGRRTYRSRVKVTATGAP